MDKAGNTLMVFGLYLVVIVGTGFIFVPSFVLDMFSLRYGDDTWPRVVGLLATLIGVYYIIAARARLTPLYVWTVWMRYFAAVFMVALLVSGKTEWPILLFAGIDACGATWTWLSIGKRPN